MKFLSFFRSIQQKMSQRIMSNSSDGGINIADIPNPAVRRSKGRPKLKRIKGILEVPNTKT